MGRTRKLCDLLLTGVLGVTGCYTSGTFTEPDAPPHL